MGFSVTVAARSRLLKDRMADFLGDVYRPWSDIADDEDSSEFDGPLHHGKQGIGFDYTSDGGPEWEYSYAFMRWTALKIGRRRRRFQSYFFDQPVPYTTTPTGTIPVLVEPDWGDPPEPYKCCVVDQYGLLTCPKPARDLAWYHIPEGSYERVSAIHSGQPSADIREALIESGIERARVVLQYIRAEIARLDVLWRP